MENDRLFDGFDRVPRPEALKGIDGSDDIIISGRISISHLFKARKSVSLGPIAAFVDEHTLGK